MNLSLLPYL